MSRLASLVLVFSLGACAAGAQQAPAPKVAVAPKPKSQIDRAQPRAALAARRKMVVDRFVAYREARVYPVNTFGPGYQHVWRDATGRLCAAATLIADDWGRDASGRIADENNFVRLADVHDGPIADWILTSGLTHEEVVAVQAPGFTARQRRPEPEPRPTENPPAEIARLYAVWSNVERQLEEAWDDSLDEATDALMEHPALARRVLAGLAAAPGRYQVTTAAAPSSPGFAQPPG